jgi:hypothetical protein
LGAGIAATRDRLLTLCIQYNFILQAR